MTEVPRPWIEGGKYREFRGIWWLSDVLNGQLDCAVQAGRHMKSDKREGKVLRMVKGTLQTLYNSI